MEKALALPSRGPGADLAIVAFMAVFLATALMAVALPNRHGAAASP